MVAAASSTRRAITGSEAALWVGTDDGLIQLTTDDGGNWTERHAVSDEVVEPRDDDRSVPHRFRTTRMRQSIATSLTISRPHIYRTRDLGKTWQEIVRGLPADGYVHAVKEDPMRRGLLFAGTERGVFVSFDAGDRWQSLQLNLPVTSMRDFEIHGNDLVVATHGRGFWVLDDMAVAAASDGRDVSARRGAVRAERSDRRRPGRRQRHAVAEGRAASRESRRRER